MDGNRVTAIEFRWEPEMQENEGFETIGFLSQIFSHYYSELTMEGQQVQQLYAPARPEWFAPLTMSNYEKNSLPLWQFKLQPST